jgi:hypothetical protein
MINKPKYKIARRLGANIFDKTQGQKFTLREARRKVEKRSRPKSDFGLQMLEKQKAKVTYGVNERMFSKNVKNILGKGGTNVFLNTILMNYKYYNTFFIIRNYDEKYIVTINDDYYFESFTENELNYFLKQYNYKIMKIFINHIFGHNYTFLYNLKILEKEISYITHDYTGIYRESQYKFNDFCELHELKQNILEVCDSVITQNKKNLNIYSNFIKPNTNIFISELPDFSKSGNKIQINSEKIIIGIFGAVLDIKGLKILNLLVNYFKNHDNIDFIIFGETNLKVNTLKYVRYHTINRFNELLEHYKPNIILELGLCPETYSYTITLAILTQLPILCLKKNMDCTVEARLSTYNKVYFFDTIKDFTELIFYKNYTYGYYRCIISPSGKYEIF